MIWLTVRIARQIRGQVGRHLIRRLTHVFRGAQPSVISSADPANKNLEVSKSNLLKNGASDEFVSQSTLYHDLSWRMLENHSCFRGKSLALLNGQQKPLTPGSLAFLSSEQNLLNHLGNSDVAICLENPVCIKSPWNLDCCLLLFLHCSENYPKIQ